VVADLAPEDAAPAPGPAEQGQHRPATPEPAPGAPAAEAVDTGTTAQVVEFAVRAAPAIEAGAPSAPEDDEPAGPAAVVEEPAADDRPAVPGEDPAGPRPSGRRRARSGPNKRELRHQQTREAIVDAAAALFAEHGFDAVSVMQIAQRAGVVEKTVFNHFPVKEGLVFEADPAMRAALLDTVRHRPAGESVAAAAGGFLVAAISQLGSPAAATGVAEMARVVRGSRTLQAREREILGTLTEALAEQITAETRPAAGELEPWLAANAILGLYSALLELARDRVLAGAAGPELVEELRTRGQRGLALLQFGLAGYAKRR
jgi:AcrR family transcriptional regulator